MEHVETSFREFPKGGISAMVMTDMEVIARYSEAKDPAKMVGVLADLNGEPPEMIQEIIRRKALPTNRLALREIQLRKLYDAGMTDGEIGRCIGISRSSVQLWRSRRDLPTNYGRAKERRT